MSSKYRYRGWRSEDWSGGQLLCRILQCTLFIILDALRTYRHNLAGTISPKNLKQASIEANYGSTLFASTWIDSEPTAAEACWCPSSSMLAPFFSAFELSLVAHDIPADKGSTTVEF